MEQGFDSVFGAGRGLSERAKRRIILEGPETIAGEEIARLMNLASSQQFDEPLEVLRANKERIHTEREWMGEQANLADTLNMCVATQLIEAEGMPFTLDIAYIFGWDEYAQAFASGLRSRLAHKLEQMPTAVCPANEWRAWVRAQAEEHMEEILTERLYTGQSDALSNLLGRNDLSFERSDERQPWKELAAIALNYPRPLIGNLPLGPEEREERHKKLLTELERLMPDIWSRAKPKQSGRGVS